MSPHPSKRGKINYVLKRLNHQECQWEKGSRGNRRSAVVRSGWLLRDGPTQRPGASFLVHTHGAPVSLGEAAEEDC